MDSNLPPAIPPTSVPLKFHLAQLGHNSWVEVDGKLVKNLRSFHLSTSYDDATHVRISGITDRDEPIDVSGILIVTSRDSHIDLPRASWHQGLQGPRLFQLNRKVDATGVSGVGVVAEGIEFSDGQVALRWTGKVNSTVIYNSIQDVITIHGHGGSTEVVWLS